MTVVKYEDYFYVLARYATSIMDTKCKRVRFIVRWLRILIHMSTQSLVATSRYFIEVSYHA